jgi:hypothetical protein
MPPSYTLTNAGHAPILWSDLPPALRQVVKVNEAYQFLDYNPRSSLPQNYTIHWMYYSDGYTEFGLAKDYVPDYDDPDSDGVYYFSPDFIDPEIWTQIEAEFNTWYQNRPP